MEINSSHKITINNAKTNPMKLHFNALFVKTIPLFAVALTFLASTQAEAYTRLTLSHQTENSHITEGYVGDIDLIMQESEISRAKRPVESRHYRHADDVMIVSVGSSVFSDSDRDGFFTHFSVSIDIDSHYSEEEVYVRILIRSDDSDYELFYESSVFHVYDDLVSDTYSIDSKLLNNYPAGYYDLRLEVLDYFTDSILDTVDASSHQTLFALPLESSSVDEGPRDQIVHENVGSAGMAMILAMGLYGILRRKPVLVHDQNECCS